MLSVDLGVIKGLCFSEPRILIKIRFAFAVPKACGLKKPSNDRVSNQWAQNSLGCISVL